MKVYEALPDITIKIDSKAKDFLKEIEQFAMQSSKISETRSEWDMLSEGFSIIAFKPIKQRGNVDLIGQLICSNEKDNRIQVEIRGFTNRPTLEEYRACAEEIIKPLIKTYNKKHGKRLRVTVHKKAVKPYELPPGAKKYFNRFTLYPDSSHPSDEASFHMFVKYCHQHNVKLSGYQLRELLLKNGYGEKSAERLKEIYTQGRKILAVGLCKY